MDIKRIPLYFGITTILLQACNATDDTGLCLIGSGTVDSYQIDVDSFDGVSLFGPVNVRVQQRPDQEIIVHSEPEFFANLSYEVINRRLEIGLKENLTCFETNFGIWINITVPDIESIDIVGASEVISNGNLHLDELELEIIGFGQITLTGSVEEQFIDVSGEATVSNFELLTKKTRIVVTGQGKFEIACDSILEVHVTGSSTVFYKGHPQISKTGNGTNIVLSAN